MPDTVDASILQLAESILDTTKQITEYLQASNVALPTFSPARQKIEDLQLLVDGPPTTFRHLLVRGYEIAAFQFALDFELFVLVPAEGDIALMELAEKAGLDEDRTGRIIRILITHRLFQEKRPGYFSHNSFSIALQKDEDTRSMVHYSYDEMLKACSVAGDAIKANPSQADSAHCPFYTCFQTPIFDYYRKHPEHSARFAKAMSGWRKMINNIVELRDSYPWAKPQGTVVDIGGGSGHISIELARRFPRLNFAVQDGDASMLALGPRLLSDDVRDRVTFTKTNFFEPEKHMDAAAYLIRQCTHNWADHDVVIMLKSIVPGLEGSTLGTPLLINDIIIPEVDSGISRICERERRQVDMVMLVCYGAKRRTVAEFDTLLKEADQRHVIRRVHNEHEGALGLLEI